MLDDPKQKYISHRDSRKKLAHEPPVVKSTTISTQRAILTKTMKRNISVDRMKREHSLSKLEMNDRTAKNAMQVERVDIFHQSASLGVSKSGKRSKKT